MYVFVIFHGVPQTAMHTALPVLMLIGSKTQGALELSTTTVCAYRPDDNVLAD